MAAGNETAYDLTPLTEADVTSVMRLYRESIQPVWIAQGRDHDLGRIESNLRSHLGAPDYFVMVARRAEDSDAALVGYLAWEKHEDHTSTHTVAHLRMILVRPDQQSSGLGKQMMAWFEAAARDAGCTKIMFDVVVGSGAREFYARLGYRHWSDYLEKLL